MITIGHLVGLFTNEYNQEFEVYDFDKQEIIFHGYGDDIPYELWITEIASIDTISCNTITINV